MNLATQLESVCHLLRQHVTVPVLIGLPDQVVAAVHVWPWRMSVNPAPRRSPTTGAVDRGEAARPQLLQVHFLLFATPPLTTEGLALLDKAQQVLFDNPVVATADGQIRLLAETALTAADMAALFTAAQLPLTLCAAFVLEGFAALAS
jgi:hypothetical protein